MVTTDYIDDLLIIFFFFLRKDLLIIWLLFFLLFLGAYHEYRKTMVKVNIKKKKRNIMLLVGKKIISNEFKLKPKKPYHLRSFCYQNIVKITLLR